MSLVNHIQFEFCVFESNSTVSVFYIEHLDHTFYVITSIVYTYHLTI